MKDNIYVKNNLHVPFVSLDVFYLNIHMLPLSIKKNNNNKTDSKYPHRELASFIK